ncbi:MAG: SDR family oxidoreductase [Rhodospirillales bacterium]|nr:SDR family oxidoreductase [Rhodospirillales bacterium]
MDLGIKDKVAVVTGGSTGIGNATARELGENGAKIVITARGRDRLDAAAGVLQDATGAEVLGVAADVSAPDDADRVISAAADAFGSVDILVNNAGRAHAGGVLQTTDEDWRDMTGTKLLGMIHFCQAAVPHMRKNGWGRIVNMSSVGGIYPNPKLSISHALSAGINNLTKSLALEVATDGILVNAIGIGAVITDNWANNMIPKARETHPDWADLSDDDLVARLGAAMTPVGHFGKPEDIAALAAFLASGRNRFVTGATVEASGGADRFI